MMEDAAPLALHHSASEDLLNSRLSQLGYDVTSMASLVDAAKTLTNVRFAPFPVIGEGLGRILKRTFVQLGLHVCSRPNSGLPPSFKMLITRQGSRHLAQVIPRRVHQQEISD